MSFTNYTLAYRTFNQLIDDIRVDLPSIDLDGFIEPQTLIKVARKINAKLGLRINQTSETVLEIERYKVKLPDNFQTLNFMLLCEDKTVKTMMPSGTQVEERVIGPVYQPWPEGVDLDSCQEHQVPNCPSCVEPEACEPQNTRPRTCLSCDGNAYELIQTFKFQTIQWRKLVRIKLTGKSSLVDCACPNYNSSSEYEAYIKDGWLHTNFAEGNLYINYQADMVDDEGNLIVPDHALINDYYEYALKDRILENMVMNNESVGNKLQLAKEGLRVAKAEAMTFVNTPNFAELQKMHQVNRKAFYHKYYKMFSSF